MSAENHKAYAIKQKEIDYNERDLLMVQAQLINRNSEGHVFVEKVSKDAGTYSAGKYYIPGVAIFQTLGSFFNRRKGVSSITSLLSTRLAHQLGPCGTTRQLQHLDDDRRQWWT